MYSFTVKYGIVFWEYRNKYCYFEFIKVIEKCLILFVVAIIVDKLIVKFELIILIIIIYGSITNSLKPYMRRHLSFLDSFSAIVINATLIFGVITLDISENKLILSLLIGALLFNFFFMMTLAH